MEDSIIDKITESIEIVFGKPSEEVLDILKIELSKRIDPEDYSFKNYFKKNNLEIGEVYISGDFIFLFQGVQMTNESGRMAILFNYLCKHENDNYIREWKQSDHTIPRTGIGYVSPLIEKASGELKRNYLKFIKERYNYIDRQ